MEIVSFSSDALIYFIFKIMIQLLTNRNGENIKESYDNLYLSTGCMVLLEYDRQVILRTHICTCILTMLDQHIIRLYQHNV